MSNCNLNLWRLEKGRFSCFLYNEDNQHITNVGMVLSVHGNPSELTRVRTYHLKLSIRVFFKDHDTGSVSCTIRNLPNVNKKGARKILKSIADGFGYGFEKIHIASEGDKLQLVNDTFASISGFINSKLEDNSSIGSFIRPIDLHEH